MKRYALTVKDDLAERIDALADKRQVTVSELMRWYLALGILIEERMQEDPPCIYMKIGEELKGFVLIR